MDAILRMDWLRPAMVCAAAIWAPIAGAQEGLLILAPAPVESNVQPPFVEVAAEADVLFLRDDEEQQGDDAKRDGYWLGVQIAALPELVKQQLGIEHGLTVEDVAAESPAAKAEIKRFDILVTAGDMPLKDAADLVKSVDASAGKEMAITVLRGGKDRKIVVTATKRPEKERIDIRVPQPEIRVEIKRLEEALESLKKKAGDGSLGLWFAKPAIVAPRVEYRLSESRKGSRAEFPKDLTVHINRQGDQPIKVYVKRGDNEWNLTQDKTGISLRDLPDDIRPHVQRMLQGIPAPGPVATRTIRVSPEGRVDGELRIAPVPPAPPVPPVAPRYAPRTAPAVPATPVPPTAPPATRAFSYRTDRSQAEGDSKLDAILKKLDKLESGTLENLDKEMKKLRQDLDELRTKSPGDKR